MMLPLQGTETPVSELCVFLTVWEWTGGNGRKKQNVILGPRININKQSAITPSAEDNCCNKCESKIFNLEKEIVLTLQLC